MMYSQYLLPLEIKQKRDLVWDIKQIDETTTGLVDAMFANRFISEACIMLFNSINLLELGYFDSAFYSLRQAIEIATTMCYLVELENSEKKEELKKWNSSGSFMQIGQMLNTLDEFKKTFYELKEVFHDKFAVIKDIKQKLNKYVHKQGNNKLYTYIHSFHALKFDKNIILKEFERYLHETIGIIAIMRLTIDPLPILLADKDIYHRTGDFLTQAYADEFIEKYIGFDAIKSYSKTSLYSSYYSYFINFERQSEDISNIRKYGVLDIKKIPEIKKQLHLLSLDEQMVVLIFELNEKITRVYLQNSILPYTTDRKSLRGYSCDSRDFDNFTKAKCSYNQKYEGIFISYFKLDSSYYQQGYILEHNKKLTDSESALLKFMIDVSANKINLTYNKSEFRGE